MQQGFKAVAGQQLRDVCLNTYGTLDHLVKIAVDSNVADINHVCSTGETFIFDTDFVVNLGVLRNIEIKEIRYLTTQTPDPVAYGLNY